MCSGSQSKITCSKIAHRAIPILGTDNAEKLSRADFSKEHQTKLDRASRSFLRSGKQKGSEFQSIANLLPLMRNGVESYDFVFVLALHAYSFTVYWLKIIFMIKYRFPVRFRLLRFHAKMVKIIFMVRFRPLSVYVTADYLRNNKIKNFIFNMATDHSYARFSNRFSKSFKMWSSGCHSKGI